MHVQRKDGGPSPLFFISADSKGVKGVRFDIVLQVLISKKIRIKEVEEVKEVKEVKERGELGTGIPISRVFAYEWQGKDLRDRERVRVAGKGLTGGHFCASARDGRDLWPVRCDP
jgi:hypothetical protein